MPPESVNSDFESLMTLQEVAEYLRLSEHTVYKKVQAGEIPGFKVGKQWRFRRSEIDEWFKQQGK